MDFKLAGNNVTQTASDISYATCTKNRVIGPKNNTVHGNKTYKTIFLNNKTTLPPKGDPFHARCKLSSQNLLLKDTTELLNYFFYRGRRSLASKKKDTVQLRV